MKNTELKELALNLNNEQSTVFRDKLSGLLKKDLSSEEFCFAVAIDYTRSKLFNEPTTADSNPEELAEGLYKLGYFFSLHSKDRIAYSISCFSLPLLNQLEHSSPLYIRAVLFHMMCAFENGYSAEVLRTYNEVRKLEEYIPEKIKVEYYKDLGLGSMQLVNDSDPAEYFEKALEFTSNEIKSSIVRMNIADLLYLRRSYENALAQLEKIEGTESYPYMKGYALTLKLKVLLQTNELGGAGKIARELERLIERREAWTDIANSYVFLGHYSIRIGKLEDARRYLLHLKNVPGSDKTRYISGETKVLEAGIINASNKPLQALEKTLSALHELSVYRIVSPHLGDLLSNLEKSVKSIFKTLIDQLHKKDNYNALHTLRVSMIASDVGKTYGLPPVEIFNLTFGAMLHDYGKIEIPDEILSKPGKLTREEFEVIKKHPVYGAGYLVDLSFPSEIKEIVLQHHERLDGSGYPGGLKHESISDMVQIVAISDVYDALTTDRPYRRALTTEEAISMIEEEGDKIASLEVRNAFFATIRNSDYRCTLEDVDKLCHKTIMLITQQ